MRLKVGGIEVRGPMPKCDAKCLESDLWGVASFQWLCAVRL